jgi:hypothetical protein
MTQRCVCHPLHRALRFLTPHATPLWAHVARLRLLRRRSRVRWTSMSSTREKVCLRFPSLALCARRLLPPRLHSVQMHSRCTQITARSNLMCPRLCWARNRSLPPRRLLQRPHPSPLPAAKVLPNPARLLPPRLRTMPQHPLQLPRLWTCCRRVRFRRPPRSLHSHGPGTSRAQLWPPQRLPRVLLQGAACQLYRKSRSLRLESWLRSAPCIEPRVQVSLFFFNRKLLLRDRLPFVTAAEVGVASVRHIYKGCAESLSANAESCSWRNAMLV